MKLSLNILYSYTRFSFKIHSNMQITMNKAWYFYYGCSKARLKAQTIHWLSNIYNQYKMMQTGNFYEKDSCIVQ